MTAARRYDVAVIGAGPAGCATAVALARGGLTVAMVDASSRRPFRIGETVPPAIQPELAALGAWRSFVDDAHLPAGTTVSAWGDSVPARREGFAHPLGGGWHLDRGRFDATLAREAVRRGALLLDGTRVATARRRASGDWSISLRARNSEARELDAAFLVDATGRAASIARRNGAARLSLDRTIALHATVDLRDRTDVDTVIEAEEHGWWYAARVPGGGAVVSFFTDAGGEIGGARGRAERWYRRLRRTDLVWSFLGRPSCPTRIAAASAASHILVPMHGRDWLAVGDAGTAWDPLSSAGIVLALRSGRDAAQAISQYRGGDATALSRYERRVQIRFTRFALERRAYYSTEKRWPASEFWRSRGAPPRGDTPGRETVDEPRREVRPSREPVHDSEIG